MLYILQGLAGLCFRLGGGGGSGGETGGGIAFLLGGVSGAFGFKQFGYGFTIPIAVLLAIISVVPAWDDIRRSARTPSTSNSAD